MGAGLKNSSFREARGAIYDVFVVLVRLYVRTKKTILGDHSGPLSIHYCSLIVVSCPKDGACRKGSWGSKLHRVENFYISEILIQISSNAGVLWKACLTLQMVAEGKQLS